MKTQGDTDCGDACPPTERLSAYSLGALSPHGIEVVAAHLDTCPRCLRALGRLAAPADPLLDSLAGLRGIPARRTPEETFLVEQLAGICFKQPSPAPGPCRAALPGRIGPYEILEPLGEGGMGSVYKARHILLGKVVALKVLSGGRGTDEAAVARFMQEMKAAGQLSHPNIVVAHDAGIDSLPYLAMEFLEGMDLSRLVQEQGPLPVPEACECVRQAALALQHAFDCGLVHRDIKPSNLLLTPEGCIKLLDLGLARLGADLPASGKPAGCDGSLTSAGAVMGTIDYISPEQLRDSRSVDIRADLYSLGCTLYQLLAGAAPFDGVEGGHLGKQMAHLREPAPRIRLMRPEVPEELGIVVERLLAKNPDYRFKTPADVAAALEPFSAGCTLRGLTPRSTRDGSHARGVAPLGRPGQPFSRRAPAGPPAPSGQPHAGIWITAALIFLMAVGAVLIVMRPPGEDPNGGGARRPEPLLLESFEGEQFRTEARGVRMLGQIGVADLVRQGKDSLRIRARLSEAAHLALVAYRPDGKDVLCAPLQDEDLRPSKALVFPGEGLLPLEEPGMHAFVLVAGRRPLPPYGRWRTGPAAWPEASRGARGVWKFDGREVIALNPERAALAAPAPPGLHALCDLLAARPGVDAVQAVAFWVQPEPPPQETSSSPK